MKIRIKNKNKVLIENKVLFEDEIELPDNSEVASEELVGSEIEAETKEFEKTSLILEPKQQSKNDSILRLLNVLLPFDLGDLSSLFTPIPLPAVGDNALTLLQDSGNAKKFKDARGMIPDPTTTIEKTKDYADVCFSDVEFLISSNDESSEKDDKVEETTPKNDDENKSDLQLNSVEDKDEENEEPEELEDSIIYNYQNQLNESIWDHVVGAVFGKKFADKELANTANPVNALKNSSGITNAKDAITRYLSTLSTNSAALLKIITAPSLYKEIAELFDKINGIRKQKFSELEDFFNENRGNFEKYRSSHSHVKVNQVTVKPEYIQKVYNAIVDKYGNKQLIYLEDYRQAHDKREWIQKNLDNFDDKGIYNIQNIAKNESNEYEFNNYIKLFEGEDNSSNDTKQTKIELDAKDLHLIYDDIRNEIESKVSSIISGTDPESIKDVRDASTQMSKMIEKVDAQMNERIDQICRVGKSQDSMGASDKVKSFISKHPLRANKLHTIWDHHLQDLYDRAKQRIDNISNTNNSGALGFCYRVAQETIPELYARMITLQIIANAIEKSGVKLSDVTIEGTSDVLGEESQYYIWLIAKYGNNLTTSETISDGKKITSPANLIGLLSTSFYKDDKGKIDLEKSTNLSNDLYEIFLIDQGIGTTAGALYNILKNTNKFDDASIDNAFINTPTISINVDDINTIVNSTIDFSKNNYPDLKNIINSIDNPANESIQYISYNLLFENDNDNAAKQPTSEQPAEQHSSEQTNTSENGNDNLDEKQKDLSDCQQYIKNLSNGDIITKLLNIANIIGIKDNDNNISSIIEKTIKCLLLLSNSKTEEKSVNEQLKNLLNAYSKDFNNFINLLSESNNKQLKNENLLKVKLDFDEYINKTKELTVDVEGLNSEVLDKDGIIKLKSLNIDDNNIKSVSDLLNADINNLSINDEDAKNLYDNIIILFNAYLNASINLNGENAEENSEISVNNIKKYISVVNTIEEVLNSDDVKDINNINDIKGAFNNIKETFNNIDVENLDEENIKNLKIDKNHIDIIKNIIDIISKDEQK